MATAMTKMQSPFKKLGSTLTKAAALDVQGMRALLQKPKGSKGLFGADEPQQPTMPPEAPSSSEMTFFGLLAAASMAASAYHGYKRNHSVGWSLWWGLMGAMFPVITPVIALAQGYGKRK